MYEVSNDTSDAPRQGDARPTPADVHPLHHAGRNSLYDRACLLGLRRASLICRLIDVAGQRDGLIREPIDCVEAIDAEIERICHG